MERSRFVGSEEAAEYLGVSVRLLRRLVADREVRYFRIGRLLRFDPDDLDAAVRANEVPIGNGRVAGEVWSRLERLG